MSGLCLDTSALLAYASGVSVEPGSLIILADEDPDQRIWVPALCLLQAHLQLARSGNRFMLDLLLGGRKTEVAPLDGPMSGRVAALTESFEVPPDAAHAVITASDRQGYLVTADAKLYRGGLSSQLDVLDISETWDDNPPRD